MLSLRIFVSKLLLLSAFFQLCLAKPVINCIDMRQDDVINYFIELGHLPKTYSREGNTAWTEQFIEAIKSFQKLNGIPESGIIDNETCELMEKPKCAGLVPPDSIPPLSESKNRVRRYASFELMWPRKNLTWRLLNENMSNLDENWVKDILRKALDVWSQVTPLNFREVNDKKADIEIGFSRDLQRMFKTTQRILGYANPPNPTKVALCFDANQNWALSPREDDYSSSDLMYAAVHELGHALGLDHSYDENAIMYPIYRNEFKGLHEDDRKGIQSLYGPRGKDPSKKSRIQRMLKSARSYVRWKALAISEPIKKGFRYVARRN